MPYQTTKMKNLDRTDHVWYRSGQKWKCVLCGATTKAIPPDHPTDPEWVPDVYEKLEDKERNLAPFDGGSKRG